MSGTKLGTVLCFEEILFSKFIVSVKCNCKEISLFIILKITFNDFLLSDTNIITNSNCQGALGFKLWASHL
jgi:hypothetical protein